VIGNYLNTFLNSRTPKDFLPFLYEQDLMHYLISNIFSSLIDLRIELLMLFTTIFYSGQEIFDMLI